MDFNLDKVVFVFKNSCHFLIYSKQRQLKKYLIVFLSEKVILVWVKRITYNYFNLNSFIYIYITLLINAPSKLYFINFNNFSLL